MKVYHGSHTRIDTIDLSKCKPQKDFGKGFYVTKFRHHAESWANVICFCTLNSLQAIERLDDTPNMEIVMLSERILERLTLENNIDEKTASDIFYTSNTFTQVSDKTNGLYMKTWEEIYEMLKIEMNNPQKPNRIE